MIPFSPRCGAFALVLAVGSFSCAHAQTSPVDEVTHTDPQGRHLAPRGTFYLLDYVSARTDKGVEGFVPGAEVHFVSANREAHTLTVTDGHAQVEVPPDKLTNDMEVAAFVRAKDQANQARVLAYQQAEAKAYQEYLKQVDEYTAKDLEKREQQIKDAQPHERTEPTPTAQPVNASANTNNNGYYDEGGYGYGSPYGYLAGGNVITNAAGGNKGSLPAASGTTQSGGRQGGGSAGAGGKKN